MGRQFSDLHFVESFHAGLHRGKFRECGLQLMANVASANGRSRHDALEARFHPDHIAETTINLGLSHLGVDLRNKKPRDFDGTLGGPSIAREAAVREIGPPGPPPPPSAPPATPTPSAPSTFAELIHAASAIPCATSASLP